MQDSKVLEKQITKLPKEVVWCKKCVMSNQRPRIIFDKKTLLIGCFPMLIIFFNLFWLQFLQIIKFINIENNASLLFILN